MGIHSLVYVIVGGLVAGISFYINNQTKSSKLTVFFYVGLILLVFGMIKLFVLGLSSKDKQPKQPRQQNIPQNRPQQRFHSICPRCGQHVNVFDNFCSRCGNYLRGAR